MTSAMLNGLWGLIPLSLYQFFLSHKPLALFGNLTHDAEVGGMVLKPTSFLLTIKCYTTYTKTHGLNWESNP